MKLKSKLLGCKIVINKRVKGTISKHEQNITISKHESNISISKHEQNISISKHDQNITISKHLILV